MITDRTQEDVNAAISLRETKVKNFEELTDEEVLIMERGTMTINTLNRIEQKQDDLKRRLNEIGYWNTNIINKMDWNYTDIFDFQRVIDNLKILRNAFFVYEFTPNTPPPSYHYKDINALEKILVDLDAMINDVKSNYRECGTFESGE